MSRIGSRINEFDGYFCLVISAAPLFPTHFLKRSTKLGERAVIMPFDGRVDIKKTRH